MDSFKRVTKGFNFVYEKELTTGETVILEMPLVSPNKQRVNDIGWQTDGNVTIYGTLSADPESANALWQAIQENDEVNKTVSALKIVNHGSDCRVVIRAIFG